MASHLSEQDASELGLLALYPVRMLCRVRNRGEIELRQETLLLGAVLKRRRFQPLRDQRRGSTKRIQHVERRRMKRRRAGFRRKVWTFLEYRYRHAGACQ